MKNYFIMLVTLFISIMLLTGCSESDTNEITPSPGMNRDSRVYLTFKNTQGADLLSPSTPNHYVEADIRLYNIRNGVVTEIFDPHMDMPRSFKIETHKSGLALVVFTDEPPVETGSGTDQVITGEALTLLKLDAATTDTIKTFWERKPNSFQVIKVWYNGKLMWDKMVEPTKPLLEIIK